MHTVDEDKYEVFPFRKYSVTTDMPSLDITNYEWVKYAFDSIRPDYVIHCAAIGSPDYCEDHYEEAHDVNAHGVMNILLAARSVGAKIVHISSNGVYGGDGDWPYSEKSPRNPVNIYGILKKQAEDMVMHFDNYLIVRPNMFYGWPGNDGRDNVATLVINTIKDGISRFYAVDDVYVQPTYVYDCAEFIWDFINYQGDINISSDVPMTIIEFANRVANAFELDSSLILPIHSEDLERNVAKRASRAIFDLGKFHMQGVKGISTVIKGLRHMRDNVI